VSYALAAPFLYVPIRAIRRDATFASALFGGLKEGVRLFWPTLLVILICSWPAFLVLAGAQVNPAVIVRKMRPELVGYLLLAYAVITSFASYLIYASASRLRWARQAA
jgi:predicted neutral ceramidase superfamily lipid hydrolase